MTNLKEMPAIVVCAPPSFYYPDSTLHLNAGGEAEKDQVVAHIRDFPVGLYFALQTTLGLQKSSCK
jgi:hypothetical protein